MPDEPDQQPPAQSPQAARPPRDPPRPWEPGGAWHGQDEQNQPDQPDTGRRYPRQHLLPQQIKPGRSRTTLYVGIGMVLALIVAGGIAYLVLRDDGEDTRAAYCAGLRDLTHNGDLQGAMDGTDQSTMEDLKAVIDLAPNAVSDDWAELEDGIELARSGSGSPDFQRALEMYAALKNIAGDARNNCDLDLDIPML